MAEADPRSPSRRQKQLSIRSDRAVEMAKHIAESRGLSVTQVIERALEQLGQEVESPPEGLIQNGQLWVIPSNGSGPKSKEAVNDLIERLRTDWSNA